MVTELRAKFIWLLLKIFNMDSANSTEDPPSYPGKMLTYPGFTRGQPPVFVHDCVQVKLK